MTPHFLIVVTGWNCAAKADRCWKSIQAQHYKNWTAIFVSDGCEGTGQAIKHIPSSVCTKVNMGEAFVRHQVIRSWDNPDSIVVLLGMDDFLLKGALSTIARRYLWQGAWMTYGNWKDQNGNGLPPHFNLRFSDEVHAARSYRLDIYRSTAPNTFLKKLYDNIPEDRLIYNGEWIKATTESPVMFACLEMCGKDHIGVIDQPIYIYDRRKPRDTAARRFGIDYQREVYQWVISQPKFDLL